MAFFVLLAIVIWTFLCVKILRKNERGIVVRLGILKTNPSAPLGPGFTWVLWPIDMLYRWKVVQGDENLTGAQGVWRGRLADGGYGVV
jgi:regulator of protease activity HflC (stomatin/prohibitin superfamily)